MMPNMGGRLAIAGLLIAAVAGGPAAARVTEVAAAVSTDVAIPNWYQVGYDSIRNALECGTSASGYCTMQITQDNRAGQWGCDRETISNPPISPARTLCTISVSGRVAATRTATGCVLSAVETLTVRFSSGVTGVFDGEWKGSATFLPVGTYPLRQFKATIFGTGEATAGGGTGSILAKFLVNVSPGIHSNCSDPDLSNPRGWFKLLDPNIKGTVVMNSN